MEKKVCGCRKGFKPDRDKDGNPSFCSPGTYKSPYEADMAEIYKQMERHAESTPANNAYLLTPTFLVYSLILITYYL